MSAQLSCPYYETQWYNIIMYSYYYPRSPEELLAEYSLDDDSHVTKPFTSVAAPPPHPATIRAQKKVPYRVNDFGSVVQKCIQTHTKVFVSCVQKKDGGEYYYRDKGISMSQLRQLQQEAEQLADNFVLEHGLQ